MAKSEKKGENFEAKLEKIEQIVEQLESGDIKLDEVLKLYDDGVVLIKECREYLDNARKKITILRSTAEGVKEEDFE